jgi:Ca2+/Na+ antiporter
MEGNLAATPKKESGMRILLVLLLCYLLLSCKTSREVERTKYESDSLSTTTLKAERKTSLDTSGLLLVQMSKVKTSDHDYERLIIQEEGKTTTWEKGHHTAFARDTMSEKSETSKHIDGAEKEENKRTTEAHSEGDALHKNKTSTNIPFSFYVFVGLLIAAVLFVFYISRKAKQLSQLTDPLRMD